MAQLAAQDYFSRLQASGLSQLPFSHELAGMFPQSFVNSGQQGSLSSSSTRGSESKSGNKNSKKEKRGAGSGGGGGGNSGMSGNNSGNSSGNNSGKGSNNSDYKVNLSEFH